MQTHVPILSTVDRLLRKYGPFGFPLVLGVLYLGAAVGVSMTVIDLFERLPRAVLVLAYGTVGLATVFVTVLYRVRRYDG